MKIKRPEADAMARLATAWLAVLLLWITGCSKQPATEELPSSGTNIMGASPAIGQGAPALLPSVPPPPPSNYPSLASSGRTTPVLSTNREQTQQIATLAGQFVAGAAFEDRFEAAGLIGKIGTPEAVLALENLFHQEKDKDLRVELINALVGMTGCKDERLHFLKVAVAPDQPYEVREAAMDGLLDLEDARALPILKGLMNDPDAGIQKLARHLSELAAEIPTPQ